MNSPSVNGKSGTNARLAVVTVCPVRLQPTSAHRGNDPAGLKLGIDHRRDPPEDAQPVTKQSPGQFRDVPLAKAASISLASSKTA